jgi:hypothetical protein
MRHAQAMTRRSTAQIPADLRARLEKARLDLLALFRALDRMDLSPAEIPQRLIRQLFELDADYVEALWALDHLPAWISPPCFATLSWHSTNYRKRVLGSVPASPAVHINSCPN